MRRFVALPVPADVREVLSAALEPLRARHDSLRWARPEGWHVTLAFLGEVADRVVPEVVEVVGGSLGRVPRPQLLHLDGAGRFGRRLLWAGIRDEPQGSVAALGEELQRALDEAGLPVQRQEVRPHVTLARSRDRRRSRAVNDALVHAVEVPPATWQVETVELWRSHLGDGPARYEADASLPVG